MTDAAPLPAALQEIADDFADLAAPQRLELLLEFSEGLPELPERYAGRLGELEQVHECQSPLFLVVEVGDGEDDQRPAAERPVHLFFSAPPEAPTTRGFAGILHEGLDGLSVQEVLAVPEDAPYRFHLGEAVSPLRLRGMVGMLSRIKRQAALKSQA
ncbi:SufE family protein [Phycicoccus sp. M110.8]|uniref:SufE family protein n=1 Tax=Phycicoccus sp. M110.8 TaxID=3075433 RepID=UPI0028FDBC3F|nr:SufE family protein [Phycicoccus sp. M110.8]MDU0314361.1 SufE family protein [Phycicoccus sp. M110.8]